MEFTYEIVSETNINVRFVYGGEWFTFDLFNQDRQWILHPFDSSLIRNRDMSRLVISDLLQHKPFQVMLAKEGIILSELAVSIPLDDPEEEEIAYEEIVRNGRYPGHLFDERQGLGFSTKEPDLDHLIEEYDLEDLIAMEMQFLEDRRDLYNQILNKMFMADFGPSDPEFKRVQQIVRIYGEAAAKLGEA
ncbi:hypothetical protein KP806_24285 [Paenibacillus sp. N4]|uniref:hypothetical protein n=1 Tax=Paenibacillus vietnamensis TaxID=2590547 RepID=UPI001CD04E66|nr:hypothetical protein [Paenibacillus vietnamensis]MCA0758179.1 hypothetical protein [Paenibacillus vietnamensis]